MDAATAAGADAGVTLKYDESLAIELLKLNDVTCTLQSTSVNSINFKYK